MNVSREEKKVEAVKRLKEIGVCQEVIRQLEEEDKVSVSEPPFGAFYWLNDEEKKTVREFEEKHDALVYVVIRSFTNIGKMDSLLFVSDYPEEWDMDMQDLKCNRALAYVINHDAPDCSEFGSIGWELTGSSCLIRTA